MGRAQPETPVADLLSVADVARRLGVSSKTVYRWVHERHIESYIYPDGQVIRIPADALTRFLDANHHAALPVNGRAVPRR